MALLCSGTRPRMVCKRPSSTIGDHGVSLQNGNKCLILSDSRVVSKIYLVALRGKCVGR